MAKVLIFLVFLFGTIMTSMAFQSNNPFNDLPFHTTTLIDDGSSNDLFELEHSLSMMNHSNCQEIWCESQLNPYNNYYGDMVGFGDEKRDTGFWLEPPPDDILFIPPPPMPAALQAFFSSMENETMREFIIGEDPIEGVRCNFCKLFSDSKVYQDDDGISSMYPSSSSSSKSNETFISLFYALIFSLIFVILCIICLLIRYKKFRIFSNHACPVWSSSNGVIGHHKSSSSSSSTSPSDTCLSPVVNEKSPQSIIMDASLASLGKKSTISTTGKYWKRVPNNVSGNILFMEDRRGLRSLGGSSTGISDHPYSDAASCTSSPVYAELDPAVAGCAANQPMISPLIRSSFGTPTYGVGGYSSSNTYTEVPEGIGQRHRHHLDHGHYALSSNLLSDSSTYDNAAYLSASSQQFNQSGGYNSRSLRRLAAQRSAAINAAAASNQISTPLLSNQQYPPYHPSGIHHRQGFFPTGGRPMKKIRTNGGQSSVNYYKYGNTVSSRPSMMNHYVSNNHETSMLTNETDLSSIIGHNENDVNLFTSFIHNSIPNSNGLEIIGQRKSSELSSQYNEMPLIPTSTTFGSQMNAYRGTMSETHSNNDLNSAASSSTTSGGGEQRNTGGGTSTNSTGSSVTGSSSTSIKRPLPPVPGSGNGIQL
ncbi:hypothetical protein DERP_011558 [Dermatophagoides pteronyssinus]|uniref:Uncharacterized protein n=2 Tax=Dermatophagoides pteronyssinus TaxID=6956 RepID=A0ABQ8JCT0_DERPT|nr:hypothetical protein DERP_011558 [Dermatophagoides pteronyssinus]